MRRDLAEALEQAGSDRTVRVVVITGAGRAFCAGGDLERAAELMDQGDSEEFSRLLGAARRVVTAIRQMTKPVVASINGPRRAPVAIWRWPATCASPPAAQPSRNRL